MNDSNLGSRRPQSLCPHLRIVEVECLNPQAEITNEGVRKPEKDYQKDDLAALMRKAKALDGGWE